MKKWPIFPPPIDSTECRHRHRGIVLYCSAPNRLKGNLCEKTNCPLTKERQEFEGR